MRYNNLVAAKRLRSAEKVKLRAQAATFELKTDATILVYTVQDALCYYILLVRAERYKA